MRRRLQNWTVNQQYYWWEHVYKVEQYISNITWEHVYKTEQYISNITDENTFTKLNSISVILLMRRRLQNWTVYQ